MPDKTKISIPEWWDYECRTAAFAWRESGWKDLFWGGVGAMITGGFSWLVGWNNPHDTMVVIVSATVGFLGVLIIRFTITLFAAPAKMAKEAEAKIKSLAKTTDSLFEIEGVPSIVTGGPKCLCQIQVHNKNSIKADNVEVEATVLEDTMENEAQAAYYHPKKSVMLKPEIEGANSINPGKKLIFNLFNVAMVAGSARSEEAVSMISSRYGPVTIVDDTRQQDIKNEMVPFRVFVAYFTSDTAKNLARYFWNKPYRIKISASSHIGSVEQEFYLSFADAGKDCRFTLTKINGKETVNPEIEKLKEQIKKLTNAKAEKAVEKLTEYATVMFQRLSSIKAIDPAKYNTEKDDELHKANEATITYIKFNLNESAWKKYDDGVVEITPWSVRKAGVGSTRYEDDYNAIVARYNRRLMNLNGIVDGIDKYLKPVENKGEK